MLSEMQNLTRFMFKTYNYIVFIIGLLLATDHRPALANCQDAGIELHLDSVAKTCTSVYINLRNISNVPLYWANPYLSGISENGLNTAIFLVETPDGVEAEYTGKYVRYRPPLIKDFRLLKPGQSYRQTIDISHYYMLDAGSPYKVRAQLAVLVLKVRCGSSVEDASSVFIESNLVEINTP
jgi:hypothetical protein